MTTKVTVDAHAGWPVEVIAYEGEFGFDKAPETSISVVEPGEIRDFYIHSGFNIVSIRELTRPED